MARKSPRYSLLSKTMLAVLSLTVGCCAWAQDPVVRVVDLGVGQLESPQYHMLSHRRASPYPEDWTQISLDYEVSGRDVWLDEVELEWHVLPDSPKGKALLGKTITCVGVPEGQHYAAVYLRPGFVKRYGDHEGVDGRALKVMVIVRVDGREADRYHSPTRKPSSSWWETGSVSEQRDVIVKGNELLARTETPLSPVDWDFYQYTKSHTPIHRDRSKTDKPYK